VIFGLWAGLFIQAYVNGMVEERVRTAIVKEISHIQLHQPEFKNDYLIKYFIDNGQNTLSDISHLTNVKAATGRVIAKGMIATATGSSGIKVNGIDPISENNVSLLSESITEGKYFSSSTHNQIIVGEKLLKKLKLKLNSKVVLTLLDKENNIISGAFRIKGVFKTQNTPYDEMNVFVNRNELSALLSIPGEINEIAILLSSNESLDTTYNLLVGKYPFVKTETWKEISPEMDLIVSTAGQSILVYMGIIMLALAFGIINTMLMAILERTREIGMLMALGMNKLKVFTMILMETFFLVFSGAPLGMAFGYLTTTYFGTHGIDMSKYKDVYASFGISEIIYPRLNMQDYLVILEMVIITTVIASLFPARKAISLNPSEAIRK
jgi:ABC-type lipoprotein release transport system permease subunit